MAKDRKDYNSISLSPKSYEYLVNKFKDLDEVSAKSLYTDILKAVKEVISDGKIDYLMNLSQVLDDICKIKSEECIKNYQNSDGIGHFNLVSLACKNKVIKVLEYIFSEESKTLYNLCIKLTGVFGKGKLLKITDEFCHNAFYYAMRSNMTDLLNIIVEKWQSEYSDEELDDLLSQSYKELKLRNVSLTIEMQLFLQSKILDLRFFQASTAGNSGTGNTCEQIKKRIELVVRYIRSIKNDYRDKDPDENFIRIAEFIAKSVHILKLLMNSTYDRFPWEEIEFCLLVFISCTKYRYEWNLMYNCVLNKKQLLKHLFNFSVVLETFITQDDEFKNNDVIQLAKSLNLKRESAIDKIIKENSEFRELYDDYEKLRDYCSLILIESYADLIESRDAPGTLRHLLVSRVLQVMGEHLKNTLYSPKLSTKTADTLLSSLSFNTREIVTKLRDSLSSKDTHFIRSEIENKSYFLKNIEADISRIKDLIPDILYRMRIVSVQNLMKKVKLCEKIEDVKECYGPYRRSLELLPKEIDHTNTFKGDFERLEESLLFLDKNLNDKTTWEETLFEEIRNLIQKEKERLEILKRKFHAITKSVSRLKVYVLDENNSCHIIRKMADAFSNVPLEAPSRIIIQIGKKLNELLESVMPRMLRSKSMDVNDILWKITAFLKFERGSVKWIEEFSDVMCRNVRKKVGHQKLCHGLSESLLTAKLSQLKEAFMGFDSNVGTSKEDLSSFESNRELKAVTEMLLLDILCILESSKCRNPFYLDNDFPLLTGRNLRNHLAHENILINICLENSAAQIFVNAKNLLNAVLSKDNKEMYKVIKCDYIKLGSSIEYDLRIINNQRKLFDALEAGNMKDVEKCVNEGADVYGRDCKSSTCLHFAGKAPGIAAVKWVLKQDLSIDSKDTAEQTALHIAAKFNRIEVVRYLVEQKHVSLAVSDVNDDTPLHLAVENKSNDVVEYISKFDIFTTKKNMNGSTPLHMAILSSNNDAAKILLEKETNVDENKTNGNFTALHTATLSKNLDLVKILMAKKASVYSKTDFGGTPLHTAALRKHLEIAKALVVNGADVNAKNEGGITPLEEAAQIGSMEMVNFLSQHGADINASDYRRITALMLAAKYGHASVTELLLQKGAFVDTKNILGFTPLHYAAFWGHYEIVELLLNHRAIIDCKNYKKRTALHLSAVSGHKEIVELLLEKGADINAVDSTYSTASSSCGSTDIVDIN
ncbi:Ankyrin-1 [Araneus ventricosus]|uniref:Alpha-latrotoxin n=1 Tax=Araneus ventricosus TaxID=182803 RepID=A0A4Y2SVN0_ARAVE|nr:Ankyrin-1 [Araneus ventricosus]